MGPNGAGKSTLLRVLAGIHEPITGSVESSGRISPLFDIGLGMDDEATGYENIVLRGMLLGYSRSEIKTRVPEVAEFSELGEYLSLPIRSYSDGMKLRLAFSICTAFDPEILLMDEGILAGDAHFITKASRRLEEYIGQSSIFVLASHADDIIERFCDKAALLLAGGLVAYGPVDEVLAEYRRVQKSVRQIYWNDRTLHVDLETSGQDDPLAEAVRRGDPPGLLDHLEPLLQNRSRPLFVDVGAGIGLSSLLLSRVANDARVIAFENSRVSLEVLQRNINLNAIENVRVIRSQLWSENLAPGLELDRFIGEEGEAAPDFVRIAANGYELDVLQGARGVLSSPDLVLLVAIDCRRMTLDAERRAMTMVQLLFDHSEAIYRVDPVDSSLVRVTSFAQVRNLMMTGGQREDLLCVASKAHVERLQEHEKPANYCVYHAGATIESPHGSLALLGRHPDGWNQGNTLGVLSGINERIVLKAELSSWRPPESSEVNHVLLAAGNRHFEYELGDEPVSIALDLPARGSAFLICSTVRKASEIWPNDDPREVGFKIDSIELEFCERAACA